MHQNALTTTEMEKLLQVLESYKDKFTQSDSKFEWTTLTENAVFLEDTKPIKLLSYKPKGGKCMLSI